MRYLLIFAFWAAAFACKAQIHIIDTLENQNIGEYSYYYRTNTLTFSPGKDSLNTAAVWFNFGISGFRTDTLLTVVEKTTDYVHRANFVCISHNNSDFERIASKRLDGAVSISLKPQSDTIYLAMGFPYTYSMLENWIESIRENVEVERIAETKGGRGISMITINARHGKKDRKQLVWIICRQHAFESAGNYVLEGMVDYLTGPECSKRIRKDFVFKIVPMVDVESVYKGQTGRMSLPRDYNRDWNNPIRPEIKAIEAEIYKSQQEYNYNTFWDLHTTFPGGLVNYNLGYFDICADGDKGHYIYDYWKNFERICGFAPRRLVDDSFSYSGMPSDIWNMNNFSSLRISSTLEVDWNLTPSGKPWTIEQYRKIGADMIKAMAK
ncbi:MAG: hypothetical protein MJZ66_04220 [Bacteroidales bacterium]|nr:hypothetical protein [Bacteroidales bacterium]